jgi:hypothetical protein
MLRSFRGPITAAQSLAIGAFLLAGGLIGAARLIVGFGVPHIHSTHGAQDEAAPTSH